MGCSESKSSPVSKRSKRRKKASDPERSGDHSGEGFSSLSYDRVSLNSRGSAGSTKKKGTKNKKKTSASTSGDGNPLAAPPSSQKESRRESDTGVKQHPECNGGQPSSDTTATSEDAEVVHQVAVAIQEPSAVPLPRGTETSQGLEEKIGPESKSAGQTIPSSNQDSRDDTRESLAEISEKNTGRSKEEDETKENDVSDTSSLILINKAPKEMPKQGSKAAAFKEGVVGKVAATGDAKTTSSMSSVQSGWFFMSSQSQDGMIYMNGLVEKQFDQEKQLMGGFFQPERSQLFQLGITAYLGTDDVQGDYYLQSLETPSIELLLTFTSEVQRREWFNTGGALESVPFRNKRLVYQWFSELGSDIRPVKVTRKVQNPSIASGISGGESSTGRTNNSEKSATKGRPLEALSAKNLLLNDKLLKQVENRSQLSKKKKTVGLNGSTMSRSSVSQSSHSDSQVSSDSKNNFRMVGVLAAERMSDHGSSVSDLLELEQERERFDQEEERRRMSNATDL